MRFSKRLWRAVTKWFRPKQTRVRRTPQPFLQSPKRQWSGAGSGTEEAILQHLSRGPMTRKGLDAVLDTTTASQILPRMVERGQIQVRAGTRPYVYEIATTAVEPAPSIYGPQSRSRWEDEP